MTKTETLLTLFAGYGEEQNQTRIKAYLHFLKDVPGEILEKAIYKVTEDWQHATLPPVGVIFQACKSIYNSENPDERLATWAEAIAEIENAMRNTPWGHKPKFSKPEIEKTVKAYGWSNIHGALSAELPTIRAQLRRIYEDICSRVKEDSQNSYLLGNSCNPLLDRQKSKLGQTEIAGSEKAAVVKATFCSLAARKAIN